MRTRLLEALRTVFLIPMVLPPIVVAIIWKVIYTPDISPMHGLFRALGWNVPALITDPNWALTSIIIADTWEWFPFTMLMVLAALQMMPQELLDAAKVDGASPWQLTWFITLPFIQGVHQEAIAREGGLLSQCALPSRPCARSPSSARWSRPAAPR